MTPLRTLAVCVSVVVLSVMMAALPAAAQLIQLDPGVMDTAPTDTPHLPLPQVPPAQSIAEQAARGRDSTAVADAGAADIADDVLVPLRSIRPHIVEGEATRLTGEASAESFILFLPETPGATELRIAHRTGIDALPERSSLRILVNDVDIGEIRPENFSEFGQDVLAVPDGLLRAGRNSVEVRALQTHRVACGPDASFALWTEIDAANSGIVVSADSFGVGPVGFLAAIAAQAGRGQPITVRRPDPDASLLDAAPFMGQVAAALGGTPPEIVSAPFWGMAPDTPELARITALPAGAGLEQPRIMRGGDGAMVLLVERDSDYASISSSLMEAFQPAFSTRLPVLTPGQEQTLSDLGSSRLTGQGRYILMSVDFALPWNWVLLASQKARLVLDYRFAQNLPDGALLLVKVNGTPVRMLPLDRDGGHNMPSLPVAFGANLLHPGANRLEFEALIPGDPPDAACPPMDGPVVEISEGSRLFVPASPSMTLPSIDMSLALMAPENIVTTDHAAAQLSPGVVPQIAAALMLPQGGDGPRSPYVQLTVASFADLPDLYAALGGDVMRGLQDALSRDIIRPAADPAPATAWDMVERPTSLFNLPSLGGVADWPNRLRLSARSLVFGRTPSLIDWLHGQEADAALLQPDTGQPGDIWLVFAPHATPSMIVRSLVASRDGPSGQVALYTSAGGWRNWTDPSRPLIVQEGVSWNTLRPILGNYATLQPLVFLGVVIFLALLSAGIALFFLKLTRKPDQ
ncbi:cellulose biosynthesis cyclic di-GMP-binding regulatory protein BcsB [Roseinatronobacter sp. S2]|uniref:cellulose biosynthesis cyclic di-GMP-binding regulatory protein BcsB n=1 Tax=Roseinatronobacter sp. S2 TaxID=3035471 RepID=UPI00240EAD5E|nr:cellulose biosynthesis cyclic di-GMP-binding regulatory protein BcsB [Roseinatronobacter sp. S2]WFE74837.1 cellulose biosynthesis cyclic di-GMP-binding regulatory protein BcsB [Roseinatronobacter sp. S2]